MIGRDDTQEGLIPAGGYLVAGSCGVGSEDGVVPGDGGVEEDVTGGDVDGPDGGEVLGTVDGGEVGVGPVEGGDSDGTVVVDTGKVLDVVAAGEDVEGTAVVVVDVLVDDGGAVVGAVLVVAGVVVVDVVLTSVVLVVVSVSVQPEGWLTLAVVLLVTSFDHTAFAVNDVEPSLSD